jgi:ABC-type microcin C transport system permease subunit YejE
MIRLLRLGRIIRFMKFKSGYKTGMRIFQLLFFIFLIVHWIACVLFLVVKDNGSWIPPKDANYLETNFY